DTANLVGQVARHQVHALREVFPGSGDTLHLRLPAQLPLGTDLARHAGDFRGEGVELVDHAVDRGRQVEDLTADVDRDLLGEVALGDRRRHFGDIAHVRGEVAGHEIDVVGEIFPDPDHALDLGLAAQLAFGTDFARDARDFRGEGVELIDHDVDGVLQLGDLAVDIDRDLLGKIAASDGGRDLRDVAHLIGQVVDHRVDVVGKVFPG